GSFVYSFVRDRCTIPIDFVRTAVRPDSDPVMLKESCAFHKRTLWRRRNDSYSSLCHWIQPRLWQRVAKCEPDHTLIIGHCSLFENRRYKNTNTHTNICFGI